MDYDEEQRLELEALESIFMEDYRLVEAEMPRKVGVKLVPVPGEDALGSAENAVAIEVLFTLPEKYPEVLPEMEVHPLKGLTEKSCEHLLELAKEESEANAGMPMIFTVAERLKDWLVENNRDHTDQSMHAQMLLKFEEEEAARKSVEEAERRRYRIEQGLSAGEQGIDEDKPRKIEGTPVTLESFNDWQEKFIAEIKKRKAERAALDVSNSARTKAQAGAKADAHLSGREYFVEQEKKAKEAHLALLAAAGEVATDENASPTWNADDEFDEDLFLEEDDDLEDLSDDDEED